MLASSLKTSLMASANRSSTRFETRVHAPALCLPRGRRLVVTSGHCAGTYLIPFDLEGGEYHDCMCALRKRCARLRFVTCKIRFSLTVTRYAPVSDSHGVGDRWRVSLGRAGEKSYLKLNH